VRSFGVIRFWYVIRVLDAVFLLGVAGLILLSVFGVDVGLLRGP